jgi:hypothetical protein
MTDQSGVTMPFLSRTNLLTAAMLGILTSGCSRIIVLRPSEPAATVVTVDRNEDRRPLGVPPGHLPSPGQCRVWFPGRPPGQQPRAGACDRVQREAPAGSWVLYRPASDSKVVHSRVIDSRRPGVVVSVRVYDATRGTYLRVEGK